MEPADYLYDVLLPHLLDPNGGYSTVLEAAASNEVAQGEFEWIPLHHIHGKEKITSKEGDKEGKEGEKSEEPSSESGADGDGDDNKDGRLRALSAFATYILKRYKCPNGTTTPPTYRTAYPP